MIADTTQGSNEPLTFTYDDRHWRVRGLDKQLSCERLRVNLLVERRELAHIDTLDLYAARMRRMFIKEAAAELKDGILTLTLPKASRSRTKKVKIRSEM